MTELPKIDVLRNLVRLENKLKNDPKQFQRAEPLIKALKVEIPKFNEGIEDDQKRPDEELVYDGEGPRPYVYLNRCTVETARKYWNHVGSRTIVICDEVSITVLDVDYETGVDLEVHTMDYGNFKSWTDENKIFQLGNVVVLVDNVDKFFSVVQPVMMRLRDKRVYIVCDGFDQSRPSVLAPRILNSLESELKQHTVLIDVDIKIDGFGLRFEGEHKDNLQFIFINFKQFWAGQMVYVQPLNFHWIYCNNIQKTLKSFSTRDGRIRVQETGIKIVADMFTWFNELLKTFEFASAAWCKESGELTVILQSTDELHPEKRKLLLSTENQPKLSPCITLLLE